MPDRFASRELAAESFRAKFPRRNSNRTPNIHGLVRYAKLTGRCDAGYILHTIQLLDLFCLPWRTFLSRLYASFESSWFLARSRFAFARFGKPARHSQGCQREF